MDQMGHADRRMGYADPACMHTHTPAFDSFIFDHVARMTRRDERSEY